MASNSYISIDGAPKKIGKYFIGVDNAPKKVLKIYIGDADEVPQLVYEAECKHGSYTETTLSEATCTNVGKVKYTCDDCGYSYIEIRQMLPHIYIMGVDGKSRCKKCGALGTGVDQDIM